MELSLMWKSQTGASVKSFERRTIHRLDIGDSSALCGFQLAIEDIIQTVVPVILATEKISVETFKIAINLFLRSDRFDGRDSGGMALSGQSHPVLTVHSLQLEKTVIEDVRQMRRRPFGHPSTNSPVVQHHNLPALSRQQVSRRHASDSGTNDAYITINV